MLALDSSDWRRISLTAASPPTRRNASICSPTVVEKPGIVKLRRGPSRLRPSVAAWRKKPTAARGEAHGAGGAAAHSDPETDETLQHPRCVVQVLKRHFARYTPELVQQVCGVPPDAFGQVCEALTENSGPDRTTAFVYSVGWTQHTVGVQYIRTAAILQLLLGNIGRPGGGIMAMRGHAIIQGSSDIPTLYDLLPGYLIFRSIMPNRPPTEHTVQALVDDVIIPSLNRKANG